MVGAALLLVPLIIPLAPVQYRGDTVSSVFFASPDRMRDLKLCPPTAVACAAPSPAVMVVPNPCDYPGETYAQIVCHEMGHRNGWPVDHPKK